MELEIYQILTSETRQRWESFIDHARYGHPYHLATVLDWWDYDTTTATYGYYLGVRHGSIRFAAYVFTWTDSTGRTVCEVPHGPIAVNDEDLIEGLTLLRAAIPRSYDLCVGPYRPYDARLVDRLISLGFTSVHRSWHDATVIIDLRRNKEDILSSLPSVGRCSIRVAARQGYTVSMEYGPEVCDGFLNLHNRLAEERRFGKIDQEFLYRACSRPYGPHSRGCLFVQRDAAGDLLAGALVVWTKECLWYQRGASVKGCAVNTQFLHWNIIQWAQEQGIGKYDLNGIEPSEKTNTVTRFKMSLAPYRQYSCMMPIFLSKGW